MLRGKESMARMATGGPECNWTWAELLLLLQVGKADGGAWDDTVHGECALLLIRWDGSHG